jgi:hypothetical protein
VYDGRGYLLLAVSGSPGAEHDSSAGVPTADERAGIDTTTFPQHADGAGEWAMAAFGETSAAHRHRAHLGFALRYIVEIVTDTDQFSHELITRFRIQRN